MATCEHYMMLPEIPAAIEQLEADGWQRIGKALLNGTALFQYKKTAEYTTFRRSDLYAILDRYRFPLRLVSMVLGDRVYKAHRYHIPGDTRLLQSRDDEPDINWGIQAEEYRQYKMRNLMHPGAFTWRYSDR